MKTHHMSPCVILVAALMMCGPSLRDAISGALTVDTLGVRALLALGVAWAGVKVLDVIIGSYVTHHIEPAPVEETEQAAA